MDEFVLLFPPQITKIAYARVGLMGNPSDGFHGKTISLSIRNFWAEVSIQESDRLVLSPHPLNDPTEFGSLADLYGISSREGNLGMEGVGMTFRNNVRAKLVISTQR